MGWNLEQTKKKETDGRPQFLPSIAKLQICGFLIFYHYTTAYLNVEDPEYDTDCLPEEVQYPLLSYCGTFENKFL